MKYIIEGRYIEIYFDNIPSNTIRETLKTCGWHWFGKKKCWSNTYTEENLRWVKALSEEINPKPENPILQLKRCSLGMVDLVVRSNSFYCNQHHELEDMAGEVDIIDRNGNIYPYLIPIVYCKSCGVYYVLEDVYKDLKAKGVIRCQIMSYYEYRNGEKPEPGTLNNISPLRKWGYTVSQASGYTDTQRQGILEDIIDFGIMKKDEVLSYLSFFIRLNHQGSDVALAKWKEDKEYISNYKIGSSKRKKIDKIILHRYISR